jgi:hypothetical protein
MVVLVFSIRTFLTMVLYRLIIFSIEYISTSIFHYFSLYSMNDLENFISVDRPFVLRFSFPTHASPPYNNTRTSTDVRWQTSQQIYLRNVRIFSHRKLFILRNGTNRKFADKFINWFNFKLRVYSYNYPAINNIIKSKIYHAVLLLLMSQTTLNTTTVVRAC